MGLADDYQQVYSGLWGYNGALTAAAVGAVIFIPTCLSLLTGCLAVIFTAGSQKAFSLVMGPVINQKKPKGGCFELFSESQKVSRHRQGLPLLSWVKLEPRTTIKVEIVNKSQRIEKKWSKLSKCAVKSVLEVETRFQAWCLTAIGHTVIGC